MLRMLLAALLFANLLFFAWARGWLAPVLQPPHHGEREPERLAAQVRPEAIKLFTPQAASAVVSAVKTACVEAGPLSDADIGVAEAALISAGVNATAWTREPVPPPAPWLVYMGRYGDPALLRAKEDELRRLKLSFDELRAPAELAPGLALSRHESKEAADAALAALGQHGVHTAKVLALPPQPQQHWLRAARADAELQTRLAAFKPPVIAVPFAPCQNPR